ncbi:thioesterase family protein [Nocardioides panacihumi]|uniref:Thioesterase family protein n=1 Tax=Nocardioides panacihumi TaxID=400774 RepID=A0ABP5BMX0_9ACTN
MARHTHSCAVRWFDMDAYGHVNNVTFLRYLEEARMDFAQKQAETTEGGIPVSVVAQHDITYLRPLRYRSEPVIVEMWVTELGARSFKLAYEVKDRPGMPADANDVYVRAATVMVPYDLSHSRPRPLSVQERGVLAGFLEGPVLAQG